MKNKKIIFMGTPNFSVPILEMLIKNYNVELVITQPDKKVGRKKILTPSPIKILAEKYNIKVIQPVKIYSDCKVLDEVKKINPDIIITAAYGQIVPDSILNIPKYKAINVHASLLPMLRGGAPIQYALMNDCKKTGITIMYMINKLDAGDIIEQKEIEITDDMNYDSLYEKLSNLGKNLLKDTLPKIFNNTINPIKQNENEVCFAYNITRHDEKIDWNDNSRIIFNKIRSLDSVPGAYTYLNNKIFKIYKSIIGEIDYSNVKPGTIIQQNKQYLLVKCGENTTLKLKEVQISGKKRMCINNFINSRNYEGIILGENND